MVSLSYLFLAAMLTIAQSANASLPTISSSDALTPQLGRPRSGGRAKITFDWG
jgi:hypothetical protein